MQRTIPSVERQFPTDHNRSSHVNGTRMEIQRTEEILHARRGAPGAPIQSAELRSRTERHVTHPSSFWNSLTSTRTTS